PVAGQSRAGRPPPGHGCRGAGVTARGRPFPGSISNSIGWQCSALASAANCCKGHADGFGKLALRQTRTTADCVARATPTAPKKALKPNPVACRAALAATYRWGAAAP